LAEILTDNQIHRNQ